MTLAAVNIAGEMCTNEALKYQFNRVTRIYDLQAVNQDEAYSQAVEAAWMGWELKNANEDVDISNCKIDAFEKLPLGSYFEDILNEVRVANKGGTIKNYKPDFRKEKKSQ